MAIVTLKGMSKPANAIYFKYDGVFEENVTYSFPYTSQIGTEKVSILYRVSLGVYSGLLDSNFSTLKCEDGIYDLTYENITTRILPSYTWAGPPAGFSFFVVAEDNNGEFAFDIRSSRTDVAWCPFVVQTEPTATEYGIGKVVEGSETTTWSLVYHSRISALIKLWLTIPAKPDPYEPGGNAEQGGGDGDFDDDSDSINVPALPTLSAVDAKFITLYAPTLTELNSLSDYMWSSAFDIDSLKKLFADPMKAILGLSIVPVTVPTSGQRTITIGNISTGVSLTKASQQYITVDCGAINVNEYWGAYLDYSPYTRIEIYLPYIGVKELNVDDIMGVGVHVYYNIDILTGACCAMIKARNSVLYSYAGQCATSIPITGNDWTNVINGTLSAALSTAGIIAGAVTGSAPLSAIAGVSAISSASQNVMQMKPIIEKSGALSGSAGMLGVQKPYLIITRPRQALPVDQNRFTGYPSYMNVLLGDCVGITFVEQVHLENIPCTSAELIEIENLLKNGVVF